MHKLIIDYTCGGKNMCGTDMDDFSVSTKNSSNMNMNINLVMTINTITFSSFSGEWWIHVSTINLIY